MKIVIDIPEEIYYYVNTQWRDVPKIDSPISIICNAIIDGKPLPKGHGDLKDADAIHEEIHRLQSGIDKYNGAVNVNKDQYKGLCYARGIINETPTIIESDNEV